MNKGYVFVGVVVAIFLAFSVLAYAAEPASDDFNACTLNNSLWTFVNPMGDGIYNINGTNLLITVPQGTVHDVWTAGNKAPRMMQNINNTDFEIEGKFESPLVEKYQMQGILIEEDVNNFIRTDYYSDGKVVRLFVATFVNNTPTIRYTNIVNESHIRISRSGNNWKIYSSINGTDWMLRANFNHNITATKTGIFAGNAGLNPKHTASIDYFFNTASKVTPEDTQTYPRTLMTNVIGQGTIDRNPDRTTYTCNEKIILTATPEEGSSFTEWTGDASGNNNPIDIVLDTDKIISATFTPNNQSLIQSNIVSDDFNVCSLDSGIWGFVDPVGDSSYKVNGTNLLITVPQGTEHDIWNGTNRAPRLMQDINNTDFEIETKFESQLTSNYQIQGVMIEQDTTNFIRADYSTFGIGIKFFVATFSNGMPTVRYDGMVPGNYLKIRRVADIWRIYTSYDGINWTQRTSFNYTIATTKIGVYAGNTWPNPAHTASIDYFFNNNNRIDPEDTQTYPRTLTTNVIGQGTINKNPDWTIYTCNENITLAALPDQGYEFSQWTEALTGNNTPIYIVMDTDKTVNATFTLINQSPIPSDIVSDDFNTCSLNSIWTFIDPVGDSSYKVNGTNLLITVPQGTEHDIWNGTNNAARLMQNINNTDFEIETKFESELTLNYQIQGVMIEQDTTNFIRADYSTYGIGIKFFVATFSNGTPTVRYDGMVPGNYLKIRRVADIWRIYTSYDGINWTQRTSFNHTMTTAKAGVYASNTWPNPAHTASIDYFFNTASRIDPEDVQTNTKILTTNVIGQGTIARDPDATVFACNEKVMLTALPDPGFGLSAWTGSITGNDTQVNITMDTDKTINATFAILPIIIVSDDFNSCPINPVWEFINPIGDASYTTNNTNLLITVPQGTNHDVWTAGNRAARLMQNTSDIDFEIETKFESQVTTRSQLQGILIEQNTTNFMRIDFYHNGTSTIMFVAKFINGKPTAIYSAPVSADTQYLRVNRTGNNWAVQYSNDGSNWTIIPAFNHTINTTKVGVFAGNAGLNPKHTASIDYFFNTASRISPEDARSANRTLTTTVIGQGAIIRIPDKASYLCLEQVNLTALPDEGYEFLEWGTAASGNANPLTISITDNNIFTATFVQGNQPNISQSNIVSDDFNVCSLNSGVWEFMDPVGDSSYVVDGTNLLITVPQGTEHDIWNGTNKAARLMQNINNVDFEVETKFESQLFSRNQMQGIIIEQDAANFMRIDFTHDGTNTRMFIAKFINGVPTVIYNAPVTADTQYLRITRTGLSWTVKYGVDGVSWTAISAFNHPILTKKAGVFAGNAGLNPKHTARIDYFFNTASIITPEDAQTRPRTLTTNITGQGTINKSPDKAVYSCNEKIILTATPASGALFEKWSGDINTIINPVEISLDTNKTITATFVPKEKYRIYREYYKVISQITKDWRVTDPSATAVGTPDNNPATYLPNSILKINISDLNSAVRAEAIIDFWGGHIGTTNKKFKFNSKSWIPVPELGTATPSPQCYVQQWNPAIDIPLSDLVTGVNNFEGTSGAQTCYSFNWGQWGWYGLVVKVYYDESKPHPIGQITSLTNGQTITDNPTITINASSPSGVGIKKVELLAYYDGYDEDGDGIYQDYHRSYHRASNDTAIVLGNIAGSDTTAPYNIMWNTTWVPDQLNGSIKLKALITDNNGIVYETDAVENITLQRDNISVKMYKAESMPENFIARANKTIPSVLNIPFSDKLSNAVAARFYITSWNGIDGQAEPGETHQSKINNWTTPNYGKNHFYAFDSFAVPTNALISGDNIFSVYSQSTHHGMEVLWPGPALIVRYNKPTYETITTGKFEADMTINAGAYIRKNSPVEVFVDFSELLSKLGKKGTVNKDSIMIVEVDNAGRIIDEYVVFQFEPDKDYDATKFAAGNIVIMMKGTTSVNASRYYRVSFNVNGPSVNVSFPKQVFVTDSYDEAQDSFMINTSNAIYLYHKYGAGLSSMIDTSGSDWITYNLDAGAAGKYRGIPNAVPPLGTVAPNGLFHPGHTNSASTLVSAGPIRAVIESVSNDGKWKTRWEFYPGYSKMKMVRSVDKYWFLYEGTPGGSFELDKDYMVLPGNIVRNVTQNWASDINRDEWVYFSDSRINRVLFLSHAQDDKLTDSYWTLDNAMTVFGFGRSGASSIAYLTSAHEFSMGFLDTKVYNDVRDYTLSTIKPFAVQIGMTRYASSELKPLITSDDFNACTLNKAWDFINPLGDSSFTINGENVIIKVPGGTNHDITSSAINAPRIMQNVSNPNFDIIVKFDSNVSLKTQLQGILVEQNNTNFVRFNVYHNGSTSKIYAARIVNGGWVTVSDTAMPSQPNYLRIVRIGTIWTLQYSQNGQLWNNLTSFTQSYNITKIGVFAGNSNTGGSSPEFTSRIDYFFDAYAPISPEDAKIYPRYLTINSGTNGTVTKNPNKQVYSCNEEVILTAVPNQGSIFTEWSGAATGDNNPITILLDTDKTINATFTARIVQTNQSNIISDDFNNCTIKPIWEFVDPVGDSSYTVNGTNLLITVPQGTNHDVWTAGNRAARLMQKINNTDFEIEARLESQLMSGYQLQGMLIEQSTTNFMRVDYYTDGTTVRFFVATFVNNTPTIRYNSPVTAGYIKVNRTADNWKIYTSSDGRAWTQRIDFNYTMTTNKVGVFSGNAGLSPAHTAKIDYFFNNLNRITPEDFDITTKTLTTNIIGQGTINKNPDKSIYNACSNEQVTLTAVPNQGNTFIGWAGAATGNNTSVIITMDADRTINATFTNVIPINYTITISNISVIANTNSAQINWSTDKITNSIVQYGLTSTYTANVTDQTGVTSHSINIPLLQQNTTYHYKIISNNQNGNASTQDATFTTASTQTNQSNTTNSTIRKVISDDFNVCSLNSGVWEFVDPVGNSTYKVDGTNLLITVPRGSDHDVWTAGNRAARLMQKINNTDFEIEIKLESELTAGNQLQGIIIEQDTSNFIRTDYYTDGSKIRFFVAKFINGTPTIIFNSPVNGSYIRVNRTGNSWLMKYSIDGNVWISIPTFSHAITVNKVGVFAGNSGPNPAHTAKIDYLFNTASRIDPEDVQVYPRTLNVNNSAFGSVIRNPSKETYSCNEEVSLNAISNNGYMLVSWTVESGGSSGSNILTQNPLRIILDTNKTVTPTFIPTTTNISIWYGDTQNFGYLGTPKKWVNILGNVYDPSGITSMSYTFNNKTKSLNIGPDSRRLGANGDFNVDINISELNPGMNTVYISAINTLGYTSTHTVYINYTKGNVWPSTYNINWSNTTNINDVAQVVDGKWRITNNGLNIVEPSYDRLVAIGDINWTDYEILVPVTIHNLDTRGFSSAISGRGVGLGFIMRWQGHTDNPVANWQPKSGWRPFGAIGWYWWTSPTSARLQVHRETILANGSVSVVDAQTVSTTPPILNKTYYYKMRVVTNNSLSTYSMKTWLANNTEPSAWMVTNKETYPGLRNGSVVLLAHHVNATFGDVKITPIIGGVLVTPLSVSKSGVSSLGTQATKQEPVIATEYYTVVESEPSTYHAS